MFLATTADQRFWKKDEKILFLGEWCRVYDQKHIWSKFDYKVLPYHWADTGRFYRDFQYTDALHERYLGLLSKNLNNLHNENYSLRYWRLALNPWLYVFIEVLYDRYLSIRAAIDSGKVTNTWIPSLVLRKYVPKEFSQFQDWQFGEAYNQFLYGYIIRMMGGISYEHKNESIDLSLPLSAQKTQTIVRKSTDFRGMLKKVSKKILEKYARLIPKSLNKIVFVSSYLKPRDLFRLQISLGQLPYPCSPLVKAHGVEPDFELRKKITLPAGQNEFETLLGKLIPLQIPTVNVEEYVDVRQRALSEFPRQPKVIFTVNAYVNAGFNFWAADNVETGAKLVGTQHGGHYGTNGWSAYESHEMKISDRYYTWGWENSSQPKVVPLASGQLAGTARTIGSNIQGDILWVGSSRPRYSHVMLCATSGPQMLDYIEDQVTFFNSLSKEARRLLLLRLFHTDFNWQVDRRLAESFPDIRQHRGKQSFYELLHQSRLSIGTGQSTTNLETLAADFPTIAFWNFEQWKLRESARPYFEELCRVGVFHKTPESAAVKVNEVFKNPLLWWNSTEVLDARKKFCNRFARTSKNWIIEWKEEFQKLAKE